MREIDHSGFLNVDKPLHYTSHDVVALVRRRYRELTGAKKVGHAGTLDPLASGVLIVCLGKATRLSEYIMPGRKSYRARVRLGATSSTYDSGGEINESQVDTGGIALVDIREAIKPFIGEILQAPPMYSAIKVRGRKLYELARAGQSIEVEPRPVRIDSINILQWNDPLLELDVICSAGTYMRSLAQDLGQALGVGAYLSGLQRRASGQFRLGDSVALETLLNEEDWWRRIVPPHVALADQTCVALSEDELAKIQNGRAIARRATLGAERVFAFTCDKRLAAVLVPQGELWKPHKVFISQS
ncbi:MAG: tRNA pseudouridine(55) synthase TruB [Chloroflexota bacterium]|nr:tRNA pseudouridine(55) synthase TruB [Chloroflexota bacterium]